MDCEIPSGMACYHASKIRASYELAAYDRTRDASLAAGVPLPQGERHLTT